MQYRSGSVCSCADGKPRIFVSGVTEGSVADIDGRIQVNDQIIAVSCFGLISTGFVIKTNPSM